VHLESLGEWFTIQLGSKMSDQENRIPFAKKDQREVTAFVGHELLYDLLCGTLDKERRIAVEDYVKYSRDAQLDLTKIKEGQLYAQRLSDTIVSQQILTQISSPLNYSALLIQKSRFEKWPLGLKWGLEVLVIVFAIATVLSLTPWEKIIKLSTLGSDEVILAVVPKDEPFLVKEEKPLYADEGIKEQKPPRPELPKIAESQAPEPQPLAISTVDKSVIEDNPVPMESSNVGFLYRGEISVTNAEAARDKITEKISELGGRKAGAVSLGWKKTPNSSYYHFTIPTAKYDEIISFFSTYGKLKINQEKHSRVMPEGIIRLIITVDEAKR
jgi:hypothetical protein